MISGKSILEFGNGDIGIGIKEMDNKNGTNIQYAIVFKNIDSLPIGTKIYKEKCELNKYPVRMIFLTIESLDVLIKRLNQLRSVMIEND